MSWRISFMVTSLSMLCPNDLSERCRNMSRILNLMYVNILMFKCFMLTMAKLIFRDDDDDDDNDDYDSHNKRHLFSVIVANPTFVYIIIGFSLSHSIRTCAMFRNSTTKMNDQILFSQMNGWQKSDRILVFIESLTQMKIKQSVCSEPVILVRNCIFRV